MCALKIRHKPTWQKLYEDNANGKINDERFYHMSVNYEVEQSENNKRIKLLCDYL